MDLYVVDRNFNIVDTVDVFESLIWTERYNQYGEVNLVVPTDPKVLTNLIEGSILSIPESTDVMLVDTLSDEDGATTITGQSLTGFLAQKTLRDSWSPANSSWTLTGAPADIIETIIRQMCMANGLMATGAVFSGSIGIFEIFSGLSIGSKALGGLSTTVAVEYGNVYDGVKTVADLDNIGFRMYPPALDGTAKMLFSTYRGRDLTTDQNIYPAVIFEPSTDTLSDVNYLRSTAGFATAVYVFPTNMTAQSQMVAVYYPGAQNVSNFVRRSMLVIADDVDPADYSAADLTTILTQRGKDALANNNYTKVVDGQVVPQAMYTYNQDYFLGDVVELRGVTDTSQQARVTEYIRSQDASGETAYPTLSVIS